jgi:hypothetical protein
MYTLLGNANAPRTVPNIHFENSAEIKELAYMSASYHFTSKFPDLHEKCGEIVSILSHGLFGEVSDGFYRLPGAS